MQWPHAWRSCRSYVGLFWTQVLVTICHTKLLIGYSWERFGLFHFLTVLAVCFHFSLAHHCQPVIYLCSCSSCCSQKWDPLHIALWVVISESWPNIIWVVWAKFMVPTAPSSWKNPKHAHSHPVSLSLLCVGSLSLCLSLSVSVSLSLSLSPSLSLLTDKQ